MSDQPWTWPGSTVTRVIDGDSIVAKLTRDIGFHGATTFEQKLRLNRINAAPINTIDGAHAKAFVHDHATGALVEVITTKAYKYGDEWMAEVTLADGTNLSDALVAAGLALYWDGTGSRPGG